MPALFKLFSVLPLWFLHAMGWAMGWLAFGLSPTYRRRFMENVGQAGYRFAQVAASVGQAGRMVAELPRLWLGALNSSSGSISKAVSTSLCASRRTTRCG